MKSKTVVMFLVVILCLVVLFVIAVPDSGSAQDPISDQAEPVTESTYLPIIELRAHNPGRGWGIDN